MFGCPPPPPAPLSSLRGPRRLQPVPGINGGGVVRGGTRSCPSPRPAHPVGPGGGPSPLPVQPVQLVELGKGGEGQGRELGPHPRPLPPPGGPLGVGGRGGRSPGCHPCGDGDSVGVTLCPQYPPPPVPSRSPRCHPRVPTVCPSCPCPHGPVSPRVPSPVPPGPSCVPIPVSLMSPRPHRCSRVPSMSSLQRPSRVPMSPHVSPCPHPCPPVSPPMLLCASTVPIPVPPVSPCPPVFPPSSSHVPRVPLVSPCPPVSPSPPCPQR